MLVLFAVIGTLGDCWISGNRVTQENIEISLPGRASFKIHLDGAPTRLRFGFSSKARVEVESPLSFHGTLEGKVARYRVGFPVRVGGIVTLSTGVDNSMIDKVLPYAGGWKITIGEMVGVRIADLPLPCHALTLEPEIEEQEEQEEERSNEDETSTVEQKPANATKPFFEARGSTIHVHARPRSKHAILVEVLDSKQFQVAGAVRGSWTRIHWSERGVEIDGWVPTRELSSIDTPSGFGFASCGGCGGCEHLPDGPGISRWRGRILRGASVYAQPDGPPWATVVEEGPYELWQREGEAWVAIARAPGLSECATSCGSQDPGELQHAWVRKEALLP